MSSISIYRCVSGEAHSDNDRRSVCEEDALSLTGTSLTESTTCETTCSSYAFSPPESISASLGTQMERYYEISECPRALTSKATTGFSKAAETIDKSQSHNDMSLVECFYSLADVQDSHPKTLKLILRALNFMSSCGYQTQDICCILAHATIYSEDLAKYRRMAPQEAGRLAVLFMYLAHSYILDENCSMKYWHQYLFADYCDIRTLNRAAMSFLKLRGYVLRVDAFEVHRRTFELYCRRGRK